MDHIEFKNQLCMESTLKMKISNRNNDYQIKISIFSSIHKFMDEFDCMAYVAHLTKPVASVSYDVNQQTKQKKNKRNRCGVKTQNGWK